MRLVSLLAKVKPLFSPFFPLAYISHTHVRRYLVSVLLILIFFPPLPLCWGYWNLFTLNFAVFQRTRRGSWVRVPEKQKLSMWIS